MPVSPLDHADGPLRIRLISNGQALPDSVAIVSVTVHHATQAASTATLVFAQPDPLVNGFSLFDLPALAPAATITCHAGYGNRDAAIFSGPIATQGLQLGTDSDVRLMIECRDAAPVAAPPAGSAAALTVAYGENLLALDVELDVHRKPSLRGRMRFPGSALAVVGAVIDLHGVGARLGGPIRATAVTHEINTDGWTTEVAFGPAVESSVMFADTHGNRITLDPSGITMESAKDIRIGAKASIAVAAAGETTVTGALVRIN